MITISLKELTKEHSDKSVKDIIELLQQREENSDKLKKEFEEKRKKSGYLLKQRYFKLKMETTVRYCKILSINNDDIEISADVVYFEKDSKTVYLETETLLFMSWFNNYCPTEITEKEYLSIKNKVENFILKQFEQ